MTNLSKNARRSFVKSWIRFVAVTSLIALSIFVFIGLFSAGPNMRATVNQTFDRQNLADAQIVASKELREQDKQVLSQLDIIADIDYGKQVDIDSSVGSLRLVSLPEKVSTLDIIEGRLPTAENEIAIGEQLEMSIGQTITSNSESLTQQSLTIVGIVRSASFMSTTGLGQTAIGDGSLNYFAVAPATTFNHEDNIARLRFKDTAELTAYTLPYANELQDNISKLQETTRQMTQEQQDAFDQELQEASQSIQEGQDKLDQAKADLAEKTEQLNQAQDQLSQLDLPANLTQSQQEELDKNREELDKAQTALAEEEEKLAEAQRNLASATRQKDLLTLTVQDRADFITGYAEYGSSAVRIDTLALVLPVIFFAISLMVSFTTMRRMVEEKRQEMGTLRALGFSKKEVLREFTLYSTAAAVIGSLIGGWLGIFVLPQMIFNIFAQGSYILDDMVKVYHLPLLLIAFVLSLSSTFLASNWAAKMVLKDNPTILMHPKPPAKTKEIILEKLPWLWKKMSFSNKVTLRNTFRYKSRMLMTIFGVMASTALLTLGIGIRDSLSGLAPAQYDQISTYQMIALYQEKSDQANDYRQLVTNQSKQALAIGYQNLSAYHSSLLEKQGIQLFISDDFTDFVNLDYPITTSGAIISEKLAQTFDITEGDELTVSDDTGLTSQIPVAHITKNYVGHMIYLTTDLYQSIFDQTAPNNAFLIKTSGNTDDLARQLNNHQAGLTTIQSKELRAKMADFLDGLTAIILVIVLISILLVFVVLFTLTSINVAEREKELATIKVLGFHQSEALLYIFKETFLLTGLGILAGLVLGYYLHAFVMTIIPPEQVQAITGLSLKNISLSSLAVMGFTLIVMIIMNQHIKNIKMLEALKSVE